MAYAVSTDAIELQLKGTESETICDDGSEMVKFTGDLEESSFTNVRGVKLARFKWQVQYYSSGAVRLAFNVD